MPAARFYATFSPEGGGYALRIVKNGTIDYGGFEALSTGEFSADSFRGRLGSRLDSLHGAYMLKREIVDGNVSVINLNGASFSRINTTQAQIGMINALFCPTTQQQANECATRTIRSYHDAFINRYQDLGGFNSTTGLSLSFTGPDVFTVDNASGGDAVLYLYYQNWGTSRGPSVPPIYT